MFYMGSHLPINQSPKNVLQVLRTRGSMMQWSCINLCFLLNIMCHHMSCPRTPCCWLCFKYEKCLIVKCFSSALCHFIICAKNSTFCADSTFHADTAFLCRFHFLFQILLFCAKSPFSSLISLLQ